MFPQPLSFVFAILLGAASAAPAIAQISPVCTPLIDAEIKVATTPHHAVSTMGDSKNVNETITADGAIYVKIRDKWTQSPMTPQDMVKQEQENVKNVKVYTCTRLPDDSVDGVPAFVYKAHTETPDVGTSDGQIWLSKATGLPLRTEDDFNTGTSRHISIKYDYANIKAPIGK